MVQETAQCSLFAFEHGSMDGRTAEETACTSAAGGACGKKRLGAQRAGEGRGKRLRADSVKHAAGATVASCEEVSPCDCQYSYE